MLKPIVRLNVAWIATALAGGWLYAQAPTETAKTAAAAAQIPKWVRELDDEDFALREDAVRGLVGAEGRSLEPLKQALKTPGSLEFRRRAEAILRQLAIFEPGGEVVGGLKVRLTLDRDAARAGESVTFTAALANMTTQPMNLEVGFTTCGNYFECGSLLNRRGAKGGDEPPNWCVGFCGTGAKAILATIPPRSVVEYRLPAQLVAKDGKLVLQLGASKFNMHVLDDTRPNTFCIVFKNQKAARGGPAGGKYTPTPPTQPEAAYWTGTARSNAVILNVPR
jgi:hypothetical protein